MRKLPFLSIVIFILLYSCNVQRSAKVIDDSIFKIGEQSIPKEEFKYAFLKNYQPNDSISLEEEIDSYLKLYINFKLKVREARERGYHEKDSYINELKSYQKDLAKPYLTENKVTDALIQEAYNRMQEEVKASHILIDVKNDSIVAKEKITELKKLAQAGHSFDSLAAIYSTDPSAKNNGGNLGYFSSMQMVYPFETAAYNTEIGGISDIVTTRFGYHILKVFDRRPAQGQVKVAHIMLRAAQAKAPNETKNKNEEGKSTNSGDKLSKNDQAAALNPLDLKKKIEAIYQEVLAGKDWTQLARDYSQDARSKNQGGELPWLSTGNFIPSFEKVAFSLEEKGQISAPFQTVYGWHIMKLIDKKGVGPLEEVKEEIAKRIQRDSRSAIKNKQVISKLKKENSFEANTINIEETIQLLTTKDSLQIDQSKTLFRLTNRSFTNAEFSSYLKTNTNNKLDVRGKYNLFEEKSILKFESEQLETKYPDYAHLLNEYRDGILLFDIMEKEVWRKATTDTLGLSKYYESHKNDYTKFNVNRVVIYSAKDIKTIDAVADSISSGFSNENALLRAFNAEKPLQLQSSSGLFEKGENSLVDRIDDDQRINRFTENEKFYLIHTLESYEEIIPSLNEIKGRLISDYQDQLEKDWILQLKSKYPVVVNNDIIKKVINEISEK